MDKIRRISVLALTLALAVGLVTHGLGRPAMGTNPAMIMADDMAISAKLDMPMPGKCDACGDDQMALASACAAYCGGLMPAPIASDFINADSGEVLRPSPGTVVIGHAVPPDPYPPRPIGMS